MRELAHAVETDRVFEALARAMSTRDIPHAELVFRAVMQDTRDRGEPVPPIDISWRRCLNEFNLDPARPAKPLIIDTARLKDLYTEHEELIEIAQAEMDSLYEQISESGYALLLANTEGVILAERVDPTLLKMFDAAGLTIGAEWSEQREGTNGIGTCVKERRAITIHQADHFRAQHVGLSCTGAPIHDPFGRVVAVLDASSASTRGTRESQMHTMALVNASARLIEKCLFLRRHQTDTVVRFHCRPEFVDLLHDGAIAVGANGTIVAADMAGLRLLGARHRGELVGRPFTDVFDASCHEMKQSAAADRREIWELRDLVHGNRYFASFAAIAQQDQRKRVSAGAPRSIVPVTSQDSGLAMTLEDLAGEDPQMIRNLYNARRIADCAVSVLLSGPTGSGKEAFAKAMHMASNRAKHPFVAVNCAAIPESLIESELFGYAPGAFTGARRDGMRGRIAQSSGGTLFLDEIGDMPLQLQTRLLRVLEEQEVMPLGTESAVKINLRVIAASHRNLRDMLARGEFREDLYYRLNGITFDLPPLAKRRDKEALIRKCIASEASRGESAAIELGALEQLISYHWPGNIRELRNAVRTALAICEHRLIRASDLPAEIREYTPPAAAGATEIAPLQRPGLATGSLEFAERQALLSVIEQNHGNMTNAASQLGLSRNTLYRKLKRHGIPVGPGRFERH